jgi:hypothetical protein
MEMLNLAVEKPRRDRFCKQWDNDNGSGENEKK